MNSVKTILDVLMNIGYSIIILCNKAIGILYEGNVTFIVPPKIHEYIEQF